jgi:hypothetical protein
MAKKVQLGDVFSIPLPDGKFAFCRKFRDANIAVYKRIAVAKDDVPEEEEYAFFVGVYDDVLKSGEWEIVSKRPFLTEEESWPPPMCAVDQISGRKRIYHKGEFRSASEDECNKWEVAAVWDKDHIVDRIMGKRGPLQRRVNP